MNKKTLLTLLVALMLGALGMQAATNYGINVGGKEVNTDNYASVTGGDIASGTVSYNPSTKVLTLTNVRIARTGGDNYGVHNRSVDGLTIRFVGTCNVQSDKANALHLDKSTTVQVTTGSTVNLTMTACANEGRGVVYVNNNQSTFNGGGTMVVSGQSGSKQAAGFEGTGKTSSSVIAFNNITLTTLDLLQNSFYKFKNVQFQAGVDVRLWANTGNYVMTEVGNVSFTSNTACVTPADASYDSSNSRYDATRYAHFTDNYGVIFSTANFPNSSFRSQLRSLGSVYLGIREQYLTPSELQNLTSLDVSAKNISDLTGVNKLTYLKTLNCSSNQLTSLPTLPSTLTSLTCSRNQLTSLPTLPSGLTELDCSDNQLKLLLTLPSGLTSLGCANNQLSILSVMNLSKLGTLICYGNKLTSLSVQGCNLLFMIQCFQNQIKGAEMTALVSSLPTMPDDGFSYGNLAVLFNTDEGNEISNSDVNIARDKGWIPCEFDGSNWVEIVNAGLPGDVDGSGAVDVTDVNIIINIMLGKLNAADYPNANVDGLGGIDVADVNMIVNIMLGKQ